jgi:hypothetical protein
MAFVGAERRPKPSATFHHTEQRFRTAVGFGVLVVLTGNSLEPLKGAMVS